MSTWEKEKVAFFASVSKKKGGTMERIVAQISLDNNKLTLQLNCDDAMMSATLLDVVKRGLSSSHPVRALG